MKPGLPAIDKTAIGLSLLCMVHCLVLPAGLALSPVIGGLPLDDELFHRLLVVLVLPTSLIALTMGCRRHRRRSVVLWGLAGVCVLVVAAFFGHQLPGGEGEKIATLAGSGCIVFSHIRNFKLCRISDCSCGQSENR